jgi:N-acetylmuramoyl-L-alanine amidase
MLPLFVLNFILIYLTLLFCLIITNMRHILIIFACLVLSLSPFAQEASPVYVEVYPDKGDGIYQMLDRFGLYENGCERAKFYSLNQLTPQDPLFQHIKYKLPIQIIRFDGKSIRSSLMIQDYNKASQIQEYNERLKEKEIKPSLYTSDQALWVPLRYFDCNNLTNKTSLDYVELPILGEKNKRVEIVGNSLRNKVFYIMSGHGGPDPGAVAHIGSQQICEDEYAYDVALRLYRNIIAQGGIAYMIIQDPFDGIREDKILLCDKNETTIHQQKIEKDQVLRLKQRVDIVNDLFLQHKDPTLQHLVIAIHLDSRKEGLQQDIFFFHDPRSIEGKRMALRLQETFAKKYSIHRPHNEYKGTISPRSLYVLKHTLPPAVFLELGNMQNPQNRKRFLEPDNRQAMANWIAEAFYP